MGGIACRLAGDGGADLDTHLPEGSKNLEAAFPAVEYGKHETHADGALLVFVDRELGTGASARVRLGAVRIDRADGACPRYEIVAVKSESVELNAYEAFEARRTIKNEIEILSALPAHPNVVEFRGAFRVNFVDALCLGYHAGGDLLSHIRVRGSLPEDEARALFEPMARAVAHCHLVGRICHRDIKPENFVMTESRRTPVLVDFGFACKIPEGGYFRTFPGSVYTACAEICQGRPYLGDRADVYALGAVLYVMLFFRYPFQRDTDEASKDAAAREPLDLSHHSRFRGGLSEECADLLRRTMQKSGESRPTIAQVLEHPWLTRSRLKGSL